MSKSDGAVLVADDDEYFRLALTALIRGPLAIPTVLETGSLDEALGKLAEPSSGIFLALFDLSMPGMDGPGTLAAVRELYPEVRVAVVSASQNRLDVLASLETGVHGYIPKGFGPIELVRALKIILAGDIFVPAFLADVSNVPGPASGFAPGSFAARASIRQEKPQEDPELALNDAVAAMSLRQREVLAMLVKGYSNKQIASELALREGTVKIHVAALLRNLGVANRTGAAAAGARLLRA